MARVAVFGLGYVGAVSAGALAASGHRVVGVDPNLAKVELINAGRSPVVEAGVDELIRDVVAKGRLHATAAAEQAVRESDVSIICVGTPSRGNGSLDLSQVQKVSQEIGLSLSATGRHLVVVRSTMLPGSTEAVVVPTIEQASGRRAGTDFDVCVNPEFLREGTSITDFHEPPFTLIGCADERVVPAVRDLYAAVSSPVIVVAIGVAEMVKYACNAFHALKITFANEIGNICSEHGVDGHEVMDVLCQDTKLNISRAYLRPGFAFGGACLPKDLRALVYQARRADVETPVLEAIMQSNARQIDKAVRMIHRSGRKRVGVLGLSFKAGTDDLRESPMVELVERLIGKGYVLRIYDRSVSLARLHGANRAYIEREIPHIASLMTNTIEDVLRSGEVIVVGNADEEFRQVLDVAGPDQLIIDLVRLGVPDRSNAAYEGICW